jgi:hypothetical protein
MASISGARATAAANSSGMVVNSAVMSAGRPSL